MKLLAVEGVTCPITLLGERVTGVNDLPKLIVWQLITSQSRRTVLA